MVRVIVIEEREFLADLITNLLRACDMVEFCQLAPQQEDGFAGHLSGGLAGLLCENNIDAVVYAPPQRARNLMIPDLQQAELVFQECVRANIKKLVLLSSAMIYGSTPHNQGFIREVQPVLGSGAKQLARGWHDLEALAFSYFGDAATTPAELTILRPAAVLVPHSKEYFSKLFQKRIAITLPGHDPTMQLLSPKDLATAVRRVIEKSRGGVYNIAPRGVTTLRAALRLAGVRRVPVSRLLQRAARPTLERAGLAHAIEHLDYIRYSWTICDKKIRRELSFVPQRSSMEALAEACLQNPRTALTVDKKMTQARQFDDFGMDTHYIAAYGRTLFKFLHDYYWRVEIMGLEHVPRRGRAVLVGLHRGFMPWDGVMVLHLLVQKLSRYPRFLIHPGLIKFPFLFNYMTKLGGIIACQENAAYVLEQGEMLGLFPEGIRGAFALYRDAYKLSKFGRDEYVKIALRHRAPIVPFVTVGSAEIFPIFKAVDWAWWKRHTEWPSFPITPTFPFLPPVPLPAKWHTQFLDPIHIEERYPPEAADEPETVRAISLEVRSRMAAAIGEMLNQRKSIFYGSIFKDAPRYRVKLADRLTYDEKPAIRRS
jgi:1-acyl-sn-glycerol-3-phosphate acyltransferase/nucleoside-diphosphate-sugar epimerase